MWTERKAVNLLVIDSTTIGKKIRAMYKRNSSGTTFPYTRLGPTERKVVTEIADRSTVLVYRNGVKYSNSNGNVIHACPLADVFLSNCADIPFLFNRE